MNSELLLIAFKLGNALILPLWALLFFAPRSKLADRVFKNRTVLLVLAALYIVVVVPVLFQSPSSLGALLSPTLPGVQLLLSSDGGAVAGWIHFLCFDLFVAAEIRERALHRGHSFSWVSPIFFMVLMLGPLGWLFFECLSFGMIRLKSCQSIKTAT
jgi:hypothetical protein